MGGCLRHYFDTSTTEVSLLGTSEEGSRRSKILLETSSISGGLSPHVPSELFPRLDTGHFHYPGVDIIRLSITLDTSYRPGDPLIAPISFAFKLKINVEPSFDPSGVRSWEIIRSYDDFCRLDIQIHGCSLDRSSTALPELPASSAVRGQYYEVARLLSGYCLRLTDVCGGSLHCALFQAWFETDWRGRHVRTPDLTRLNQPGLCLAQCVRRYAARATDELSLEIGDVITITEKGSLWCQGKRGMDAGYFPASCCTALNNSEPPVHAPLLPLHNMNKRHINVALILRRFFSGRPTKKSLEEKGIIPRDGIVFGSALDPSADPVPKIVNQCCAFIEKYGIVDGIYRLSGSQILVQQLRASWDDVDLSQYVTDPYSIASLLKLYFRELPEPLLTLNLYDNFVAAIQKSDPLDEVHETLQRLPRGHYHTLAALARHLHRMSLHSKVTNMHDKNLAIVWAPNLLRSPAEQSGCLSFMDVPKQAVVIEFIIKSAPELFTERLPLNLLRQLNCGSGDRSRPTSLPPLEPITFLPPPSAAISCGHLDRSPRWIHQVVRSPNPISRTSSIDDIDREPRIRRLMSCGPVVGESLYEDIDQYMVPRRKKRGRSGGNKENEYSCASLAWADSEFGSQDSIVVVSGHDSVDGMRRVVVRETPISVEDHIYTAVNKRKPLPIVGLASRVQTVDEDDDEWSWDDEHIHLLEPPPFSHKSTQESLDHIDSDYASPAVERIPSVVVDHKKSKSNQFPCTVRPFINASPHRLLSCPTLDNANEPPIPRPKPNRASMFDSVDSGVSTSMPLSNSIEELRTIFKNNIL